MAAKPLAPRKSPAMEVLMSEFIDVKSPKAKGKRFSTLEIAKIEDITPAPVVEESIDDETADLLQSIRERQDLRILLHSAKDVPASSIYALISQIEKMKEDES